jgi:hypothetical protein
MTWHYKVFIVMLAFQAGLALRLSGQTNMSVLDYGAQGDAVRISAATVSNSPVVTFPASNPLTSLDVGKVILLFGVGPATTPTNNQDLIASIVSVTNGTNITISSAASSTATQVPCTYGTQNAGAFQRCVDAASGTNALLEIPAGNYLLVPPSQLQPSLRSSDYWNWRTAVVIQKGGLHFQGAGSDSTVLTGCGAWVLYSGAVQRGWIFLLKGPITNDAPLIFEGLTMDGGVQQGRTALDNGGPAWTTDGGGWDVTHDAVVDGGSPPLHAYKLFQNCRFVHWRGEMVKSVVSSPTDGFIDVSQCSFEDGNGSGFNFNFTHHINGCTFSNLDTGMEFWAGFMLGASLFENSTVTGVRCGIGLEGALTNHQMPVYTIRSNSLSASKFAVVLAPARNVIIAGNQFLGGYLGVATDSTAYQGSGWNSNILVAGNSFFGTGIPFDNGGGGQDSIQNVMVVTNWAWGAEFFAGGYGWGTNVVFQGNYSQPTGYNPACLWSDQLNGQYFIDDASNHFPPELTSDSVGQTNVITYAHGMRHQVSTVSSQSWFVLDDASPAQIPSGAMIQVQNTGQVPAHLQFSSTNPGSGATLLTNGQMAVCLWSNGGWSLSVTGIYPTPPASLRIKQ